ncbi:YceK/YidQ family lipoprotein [Zooshikella marina]|nr:YceK/YidQ family lipoprotein [Zooshikella ganghwensis]MBU2705979.1 YceK/YidQ family lipoprotein [Zooshikella ganghwensis]
MKKAFSSLLVTILFSNIIGCASINGRRGPGKSYDGEYYCTYPFITTREGTFTLGVEFLAFVVPMVIDAAFSATLDTILLPYDAAQCVYRKNQ